MQEERTITGSKESDMDAIKHSKIAFDAFIDFETHKGTDEEFVNHLKNSQYFFNMWVIAFMGGAEWNQKLKR
jgi:hypothetical protein